MTSSVFELDKMAFLMRLRGYFQLIYYVYQCEIQINLFSDKISPAKNMNDDGQEFATEIVEELTIGDDFYGWPTCSFKAFASTVFPSVSAIAGCFED
jgi:threonine synthase